jgi:outer membrane protein OmpA-like peptidoglycan-associated protein/tetratricopeptide (TPR) repeat protein
MRAVKNTLIFILSFIGTVYLVKAQNSISLKEKIANKYFYNMSYMQAIAAYEDILKEDPSRTHVLNNLGYSYKKIYDNVNAERIFSLLVQRDSNNADYLIEYARLLALSKNYDVSKRMYEKYLLLKPSDKRARAFNDFYSQSKEMITRPSQMKVDLTNFNSGQSDFSPAFYKKGLVFVSNRNYETTIKRVFEWDQTAFLDLYYIKDTSNIQTYSKADTSQGKSSRKKIIYNDDDTRTTSNDSRTLGYLGYKYVDTSSMFVTALVKAEPFSKKIRSKYHEGPVTFSADQKMIIFTRNNFNNGKAKSSVDGVNKLKLYAATIDDEGNWGGIKQLPFCNNNYSVGHPALAPGDTILYFASDMPGSYGGVDLYKSALRNGEWSTPENLGPEINTEGDEQFPYVDKMGALYFASNGHPGLGGLDIFRTSFVDIRVENMGAPINSNFDDFGIVLDESTVQGYLSSNRRRGINDDDIYRIYITKPFTIRIIDSLTGELIDDVKLDVVDVLTSDSIESHKIDTGRFTADLWDGKQYQMYVQGTGYIPKMLDILAVKAEPVITIPLVQPTIGCIVAGTIIDKDTKEPVEGARLVIIDKLTKDTVYSTVVGVDGKYRYAGLKPDRQYDIDVSKEGYFNKPATTLKTLKSECASGTSRPYDYLRDFELEMIVVGKAIKIENIYFDLAKYNIRKDAAKELDKIVKLMQENPNIIIELSSHTDCRSSYAYNMKLSDNRAKASAAYIISKGVSKERITGKGYGETKLVNDCACEGGKISRPCTDEEHQANRRTEFQVTGFMQDKNTTILNNGRGNTPTSVPLK